MRRLHVGLALHELAVNSVSYGALSKPDGFVTVVGQTCLARRSETALSLTWTETIGAATAAPDAAARERRFGSIALERVVPASLNGVANLDDRRRQARIQAGHSLRKLRGRISWQLQLANEKPALEAGFSAVAEDGGGRLPVRSRAARGKRAAKCSRPLNAAFTIKFHRFGWISVELGMRNAFTFCSTAGHGGLAPHGRRHAKARKRCASCDGRF